jgi:hypothetical protein
LPFIYKSISCFDYIVILRLIVGFFWLSLFIKELKNFFNGALQTNIYFEPKIPNLRLFIHSLGHHLGSIAHTALLRPLNFLGVFKPILSCFRYFTFKNYTLVYMGSEDVCRAHKRENRLIAKFGEELKKF